MKSGELLREVEGRIRGPALAETPLARHTTYGIGGPAEVLACPRDVGEAERLLAWAGEAGVPTHLLGRGSNLLVADSGVRGLVLKTRSGLGDLRRPDGCDVPTVEVEAGLALSSLLGYCLSRGLRGLEYLAGIPGTVGGAVAMNAGVYDCTIGALVHGVRAFDFQSRRAVDLTRAECGFAYRRSIFLEDGGPAVLAARLTLSAGDPETIAEIMRARVRFRQNNHPWRMPSAGSVFRNPDGISAGRLIEAAGMKGRRVGGAQVSALHGNFIVNVGGATSRDILALIEEVRHAVSARFGVDLELELRTWGEDA